MVGCLFHGERNDRQGSKALLQFERVEGKEEGYPGSGQPRVPGLKEKAEAGSRKRNRTIWGRQEDTKGSRGPS